MPVFAQYNFDDTGTHVADSALGNGAQDGLYLNGAAASGGNLVLDGVNDIAKLYANPTFQMDRGTLEINFTQTAHDKCGCDTLLSRDYLGNTAGGFHIDVLNDGSIQIVHETGGVPVTFGTPAGFMALGDEINLSYSWDEGGAGGRLVIENVTAGTTFDAPVPNTVTMDQGSVSQPWIIGAGQAASHPGQLDNINQHFHGTVSQFTLSDSVDNCDHDPEPQPDMAATDEDVAIDIPVLANDTDPDGQTLTVTGGNAAHGTVTVNADGSLHYVPDADYNGPDTITYTVTDPDGNTASTTVAVTVRPVNDDPVANPDSASTTAGVAVIIPVLANDTDVDGDSVALFGTPTSPNGTVVVNGDGTLTFTPNPGFTGEATIEYGITDGNGGTATGIVTVTVGAGPVRDGYVDGTAGGDLIDTAYAGDPDGDFIDAGDAILPGDAPNDDRVRAGGGNDTVLAGLGDDMVVGGAGNDLIDGGVGDDILNGESGNDTVIGGDGNDQVAGLDGDDVIDTSGGGSNPLPDRGYPGLFPADADPFDDRDTVYGGTGNDRITTGDDNDWIEAGYGNDTVDGGFDDDTIQGRQGNDSIIGGEGSDLIDGGQDDDIIYGGLSPVFPDGLNIPDAYDARPDNGRDTIRGGDGNDTIFGQDDDDLIFGDRGNDLIDGGIDEDTILGGGGNDTIIGGAGVDSMSGGNDRDVFLGGNAGDFVDGNEGGDDYDTLDLHGVTGPFRIVYDPANAENGVVNFLDADGNTTGSMTFRNIENVIPCFTPGTLIATPKGEVPVESLAVGDRVITRDNGIQEIRWAGRKALSWQDLAVNPHLKPILVRRGSLGDGLPERDMMVSPNHRMLVANDRTALYFEEHEVLVAAKHLVGGAGVHEVDSIGTTYLHLMFDRHEVLLSNGAWSESFQPGDYTLKGMGNAQRSEIYELFPELKTEEGIESYTAARRTLKKHEARLLVK
ncbi:Hint domain-containing protein [Rhodobacter ferrooxidans]|uniref:Hemolysin-type calcium-binding region n=1 Tax=Rhodobacter ferrooxidans TaxID=371731 RepID=C8RY12_9RHOB|nr:Hint domain-containing protein [Rhodobacter sp. SW2]EEW26410.1 Hemolysin-type calcium-binding region [Rhodobacter sp. SW2]